jgi:ADP-heptose:LPS heptosyltransferase
LKRIIISRTDSIGDVVLTLPVAGMLKKFFPGSFIIFVGRSYTRPVIGLSSHVDLFVNWDDLKDLDPGAQSRSLKTLEADVILNVFPDPAVMQAAWRAKIPVRIGTAYRRQSWLFCNRLVFFSRRSSGLHEAQLNMKLLEPLGIKTIPAKDEIASLYGLRALPPYTLPGSEPGKTNVILHPGSRGSAREWGLGNFSKLIALLPQEKYTVYISGTAAEAAFMKEFLEEHRERVIDLTGKMSLDEFILAISASDALVAASTGPLHIAAALGVKAIGLYAPMRPIFPERWAPIGERASYLVVNREGCDDCRKSGDCHCIREISPADVSALISN